MTLFICCMSQIAQSSDVRDENGRTELMNYVIQKEAEIKIKGSEFKKFWYRYFDVDKQSNIFVRRVCTTDADVIECRKKKDEYDLFFDDIIENIKIMAFNGANLQAYDIDGKYVTDYCYTETIYNTLSELGAPASLRTWAYYHPGETFMIGLVSVYAVPIAVLALCIIKDTIQNALK